MQLHHLTSFRTRRATRVGRGGKRGTTSGRGQKGQKSRAGRKMRPAVRDLVLRIAKKRGFRNKPKSGKPVSVTIERVIPRIKTIVTKGKAVLDLTTLKQLSIISDRYNGKIKLIGKAEIPFALTVKGLAVSEGLKKQIEKAKGTVI